MTTCDGVEHWDDEGLKNVIGTMDGIHKSHVKLGDTLDGVQANLESWGGLTAEAWRAYHGKIRVDIDAQGHQAKAVADKLRPLYDEVLGIKSRFRYLKSTIENNGHFGSDGQMVHWKLNNDGTINTGGSTKSADEAFAKQQLEDEMKALLHKADGVDQEIADALKAITTPGGAVADGPHVGQPPVPTSPHPEPKPEDKPKADDATIAAGTLTPADQLPLPSKDGTVPSLTEANARHTQGRRAVKTSCTTILGRRRYLRGCRRMNGGNDWPTSNPATRCPIHELPRATRTLTPSHMPPGSRTRPTPGAATGTRTAPLSAHCRATRRPERPARGHSAAVPTPTRTICVLATTAAVWSATRLSRVQA